MKTRKLYSLDRAQFIGHNVAQYNPTVRAIIKGLFQLAKDETFQGMTGDAILEYCVEAGLWETKQDRDKYITTWAYYVKTLKEIGIKEVGVTSANKEEELLED